MKEFDFYGEKIVISDGWENYIRLRQEMEKIAGQLKEEFIQRYKNEYRSIDQVVANVFNVGEEYIVRAASWCIELMGRNHIYNYDTERFIKSFGLPSMEVWINACDKIANSYTSIIVNAAMSGAVKQWQQNYRSKWLGSAFSCMPAVGKMPVDWSTGMEYPSVGDSIAPGVYPNLVALFNSEDTLKTLAESLYRAVAGMHKGLVRVLIEQSDHEILGLDDEKLRDFPVVFNNIVGGLVAPEDIVVQATSLVRIYPFKKELYMFMFDKYGDPGNTLPEMTKYFGLGDFIDHYKVKSVETKIGEVDFTDLTALKDGQERIREICRQGGVESKDYMAAFDELVKIAGTYARNVDGILYEDDTSADKARKELKSLFERTDEMSGNKEDEIRSIIQDVEQFSCQSRQKYISYLEEALKRAELRYKTVKNMMFDSREEAQKARKECEDFEALLASPCGSPQELEKLRNCADAMETKVKELYAHLAGVMGDVWNRQDILYSTKALYRPEKRNAYTAMWFEALELFNAGEIIGIKNDSYLKWYEMMRRDFLTVKGVMYDNAQEANRSYYKVLSHAIAYKKYIDEKNNASKGFFSSLKNSVSGLWAEKYQDDFGWITLGGTRFLPPDTEEEGAALENQYEAMMAPMNANLNSVRALMERIHAPYIQQDETLSLKPLMTEDKHISGDEVISIMNKALKVCPLNMGRIRVTSRRIKENICKSCGAKLPEDALFCVKCGAKRE